MGYVYIFIIIAVILIIFGIILYLYTKASKRRSKKIEPVLITPKKPTVATEKKPAPGESQQAPSPSRELVVLRRELMTMVMHNERIYKSNLEIARRDFSRKANQNPSETELLTRAIEIWRDDNR